MRGNHHHPHYCSCSLYERHSWLTHKPQTGDLLQLHQIQYHYDKCNLTITTNTTVQSRQIPPYYYKAEQRDKSKQNMGVNKGKWEDSLVRMYLVKRSSKFTRTGIFLFAPCPLSLTQVVVRCFDKLRGDLFKYKSPPAVFSSQCLLSLINGRRRISLCLLSFKLLLGSRCHPALLRTLSSLSTSLTGCQKWKFVRTITLLWTL